jgi:hypothetical protein
MTPFTEAEEIKMSQSEARKKSQNIDPDDAAVVIQKCNLQQSSNNKLRLISYLYLKKYI